MQLLLIIIFLGLPLFAPLTHDIWRALDKAGGFSNINDIINNFSFSDIGWLWVTYSEASYNRALEQWPDDFWKSVVDPLLGQDAVLVGAGITIVLYLIFIPLYLKKKLGKDKNPDGDDFSFRNIRDDIKKGEF